MSNTKQWLLYFGEIALTAVVGVVLYLANLPLIADAIIYILLLVEVFWSLRILYLSSNKNLNALANTSYAILIVGCIITAIYKYINPIPSVISTALVIIFTFALCYGVFVKSKLTNYKSKAFVQKIFGFFAIAVLSVGSMLVLFGIAK